MNLGTSTEGSLNTQIKLMKVKKNNLKKVLTRNKRCGRILTADAITKRQKSKKIIDLYRKRYKNIVFEP
ncbi:hypothetical protein acsn021_00090 [Anaerocolumna cellulosilytica]|uniref:Uncharacterized protein n=1 Tax=Anaerocolumna cellulosilytica TaxID=433286 RepID=A0A6S6QZB7_9FIRM|nr:hypothetical protein acsn021_00090 [Anaerocolumna cellulosilytica]